MLRKKHTPPRVGMFKKVSYEEYEKAMMDCFTYTEKDEEGKDITHVPDISEIHEMYDAIEIPQRATKGSAGYDIKLPVGIVISPGQTLKIPTGLRVKIEDGWWLAVVPRSSLGFKYRLQLDNTIGVVDSDYYNSDNEGQIYLKLTNDSNEGKELQLDEGKAVCQALFLPYGITYSDAADGIRNGGLGSTN